MNSCKIENTGGFYMFTFFKQLTREEKLMTIMIIALFLPMIPCALVWLILTLYLLKTGDIKSAYKHIKGSRFILFFTILQLLVSLFYQNWIGFGFTFLLVMFFTISLFFREHLTPRFFETMTTLIIYLSAVVGIIGFIQYMYILHTFNIDHFEIIIFNTPPNRVHSVYFNSNYYAMMINFFVGITFYKILNKSYSIKRLVSYILITLLNLFILYLTGCRTAWPALMAGLVIMLLYSHHKKLFASVASLSGVAVVFLATHPRYIPRMSNFKHYLGVRLNIWRVALLNIKTHPLFGEGPMTYWHIYKNYPNAHPTQHAHNVFIDPVLSFGIVGIATIAPYFVASTKRLHKLHKLGCNDNLVGLIVGFILMTLIHGCLDYTIFFVQTSVLFLIIIGSFDAYKKEIDSAD